MARTALTAPAHVVLQRSPGSFGAGSSVSPDAAISLDYLGGGLLDHRMPYNKFNSLGNGALASVVGWANGMYPVIIDATIASAPAATTGGIAAAQNTTSGTPLTLTSASSLTNGALITPSALTTYPFGTVIPASTVVIQSQMAYLTVGTRDITAAYDPTNAVARAVAVTGVTSGAGGAFTIRGWDIYGQPMSETITATAGATTVNGKKAWKWIASITPAFSDAHNYTFDVLNIFGMHLAVDASAYVDVWDTTSGFQSTPTVTAAVTTSPATATTGDVRGTLTITPAGHRIVVFVTPSAARLMQANPNLTGLFGVTNFTN